MDEPLRTVELPYLPVPIFERPMFLEINVNLEVGLDETPRFVKLEWDEPCWIPNGFPAGIQPKARIDGEVVSIRRLVWAQERNPVPPWIRLYSGCGEPLCVNPNHLIPKDADLNKRSQEWEEETERMTDMMSNPTARFQEAMNKGFLMAGSAKPYEYNAYREYCRKAERPFIEAYPQKRAIRVQNLPAGFDAWNLTAVRSLASYTGSPNATVAECPDGFRIGNLRPGTVTELAYALTGYFADEFGITWHANPMEAATERAEAIFTEPAPIPTGSDLLASFLRENPIPPAGEMATALRDRFNDYQRSLDPKASEVSGKALAQRLASHGLTKVRRNAGMLWIPAEQNARDF